MAISIETNIILSRGFDIELRLEHIALHNHFGLFYKIIECCNIKEINACFRISPHAP